MNLKTFACIFRRNRVCLLLCAYVFIVITVMAADSGLSPGGGGRKIVQDGIKLTAKPDKFVLCIRGSSTIIFTQHFNFDKPTVKSEVTDTARIVEQRITLSFGDARDGRIVSIRIDGGRVIANNTPGNQDPKVKFSTDRQKVTISKAGQRNKKPTEALIKNIAVTGRFAAVSSSPRDKNVNIKTEIDIAVPGSGGGVLEFTLTGEMNAKGTVCSITPIAIAKNAAKLRAIDQIQDSSKKEQEIRKARRLVYEQKPELYQPNSGPRLMATIHSRIQPVGMTTGKYKEELDALTRKIRFTISNIDTSDTDADYNRLTGGANAYERVELTWDNPSGQGRQRDHRQGQPNFNVPARYNPEKGDLFVTAFLLGLPLNNSDFGEQRITVFCGALQAGFLTFEAYYPRAGHPDTRFGNHPRVPRNENIQDRGIRDYINRSANWYFYWSRDRRGTGNGVCTYSYADPQQGQPRVFWLPVHPNPKYREAYGAAVLVGEKIGNYTVRNRDTVFLFNQAGIERSNGYNASSIFNNGNPMTRVDGALQMRASWQAQNEPDLVNVVYDHERTHISTSNRANRGNATDPDNDDVISDWERRVQMLPGRQDSFGNMFKGVSTTSARDQEFYAWINACFSQEFNGRIEFRNNPRDEFQVIRRNAYNGVIPTVRGRGNEDWSKGGVKWRSAEVQNNG